jgi:hypothetical protein
MADPFAGIRRAVEAIREAEWHNAGTGVPDDCIRTDGKGRKLKRPKPDPDGAARRAAIYHQRARRLYTLQKEINAARPAFLKAGYTAGEFLDRSKALFAALAGLSSWDVNLTGRAEDRYAERVVPVQAMLEFLPPLVNAAPKQGDAKAEARNKWLNSQASKKSAPTWRQLMMALKKEAARRGWEPLESPQAIQQAVGRYRKAHNLPPLLPRKQS